MKRRPVATELNSGDKVLFAGPMGKSSPKVQSSAKRLSWPRSIGAQSIDIGPTGRSCVTGGLMLTLGSSDGNSAGGHFNPMHTQHGAPDASERHAGDLGNIEADASGKAHLEWSDKVMKLSGADSIVGHAVIVHEKADDLKTQPTGNAGGRLACGVIGVAKP